jgi:Spy/CpxP family protein refolding chaperone
MRTMQRILFTLALVVAALAVTTASAQQKGRGRGGFGFGGNRQTGLVTLAANEAVQKDLGVSANVVGKINSLRDEYNAAQTKEFQSAGLDYQSLQNLSGDERNAKMAEFQRKGAEVAAKLNGEFLPKLKALISEDEIKRLKQIQIQAQGSSALLNQDIASDLKLSDEQKKTLTDLGTEYDRKQTELFRGDGDQQERTAKLRELRTERDGKAVAVLTAEQKEKFTALKGSPFDVSQISFGGRGQRGKNNN